jgi:hypothetical protein
MQGEPIVSSNSAVIYELFSGTINERVKRRKPPDSIRACGKPWQACIPIGQQVIAFPKLLSSQRLSAKRNWSVNRINASWRTTGEFDKITASGLPFTCGKVGADDLSAALHCGLEPR